MPQPFKFVGQYGVMTEPNGFYYMRARYYDPKVGRFISEDPIGFAGGDVNQYGYVGNQPVNGIDPMGLAQPRGFWTGGGAGGIGELIGRTLGATVVGGAGSVAGIEIGMNVYACLSTDKNGFAYISDLIFKKPANMNYLKVKDSWRRS